MLITINGKTATIDEGTTIAQLAEARHIPVAGTAIAVNGKLVKSDRWETQTLQEMDTVMIISAAYGG